MLVATSPGKVKTILAGGLLLVGTTACANRNWSDWAKVQALTAETRTEVQLHKEVVPQGNRKIRGRLHAVTDDSITLRLKDGQRRTLEKQDIHKVLNRAPFSKGRLLLGALSSTAGYLLGNYLVGTDITGGRALFGLSTGFGVEALCQMRMWKVYQAPTPTSPKGNRQAGTRNY